jgi:hypothetical protein
MLPQILASLGLYVVICAGTTSVGLGIMRLTGLHPKNGLALLAPLFAIAGWTIVLGAVVEVGIPIKEVTAVLWLASAVAAVWGAWLGIRDIRAHRWQFAVAAAASAALLNGYFINGLTTFPGSPALDGWSYISFGQYLFEYPKGTEGSLAPLYQYAAHLSGTRYVGAAILAALQPPFCTSCDTQSAAGPFLAIAAFSFAGACAYLAKIVIRYWPLELLYVVMCLLGGWLHGAIRVNNFDNILVLSVAPALVALTMSASRDGFGIRAHALLVAAGAYIYPEMIPLTVLLYVLVLANEAYLTTQYATYASFAAKVSVVSIVLMMPFVGSLIAFFWGQLMHAMVSVGPRPGEGSFPSLLRLQHLTTEFWGLNARPLSIAAAAAFFLLLLVGSVRLMLERLLAPIIFVGLIMIMFGLMVFRYHYDYGAFKTLLFGWWAIALLVLLGLKKALLVGVEHRLQSKVVIALSLTAILGSTALYAWLKNAFGWYGQVNAKSIKPFRELRQLARVTHGAAIQVNVEDTVKNAWAVYFLRSLPARFMTFQGYMAQEHVAPYMDRSWQPKDTPYILAARGQALAGELVWENSEFALWRTAKPAFR